MTSVHPTALETARFRVHMNLHAAGQLLHPRHGLTGLGRLRTVLSRQAWYRQRLGQRRPVRVGQRWMLLPSVPTFPSPAFDRYLENVVAEADSDATPRLMFGVLAVTRRCGLSCDHCSAWEELDRDEAISLDQLCEMVLRLRAMGAHQVQLTGGEPMARFDEVCELVRRSPHDVEFWLNTAGTGLSPARARAIADAGLTGVWISVDDHREAEHDAFRGVVGTFAKARAAARAAREAGLFVGVSLCPRKDWVSPSNLQAYLDLAAEWGAFGIRILEPHSAGRWAGKAVALSQDQEAVIDRFAERANATPGRPTVFGDRHIAQKLGCTAGGWRSLYVDTVGHVKACPFSSVSRGHLLEHPPEVLLERLRSHACGSFGPPRAPELAAVAK